MRLNVVLINNMKKTFENYLQEVHMRQRSWVLDDDLPNDFDYWVSELQPDEIITYAQQWGETL